jgi:uncharacterized repeat protein (TIGR03803 family)
VQFDSVGNLYGTTQYGGAFDGGTIYKIAKDGTKSILHSFEPLDTRGHVVIPNGVVIDSSTGDIYGSTRFGGNMGGGGDCGSILGGGQIYKLAADGTFTTLYAFDSGSAGVYPSGLVRDPQGNLYGTLTCGRNKSRLFVLFKYGAGGTFTVLHTFADAYPVGSVIRDEAGNLYGGTVTRSSGYGAIYKLAPDGTFTRTPDGAFGSGWFPTSSLVGDRAGNLYGGGEILGVFGGGGNREYQASVFKLAPDGTFTTLHTFPPADALSRHDSMHVYAVLPVDGTIYGLAYAPSQTVGRILFTIAPDGTYTELHDFVETSKHGVFVDDGPLVLQHGRVYGTIKSARVSDDGTIFSLGVDTQ